MNIAEQIILTSKEEELINRWARGKSFPFDSPDRQNATRFNGQVIPGIRCKNVKHHMNNIEQTEQESKKRKRSSVINL